MTDHRATPEQWAALEDTATACMSACILELRARVEALEAFDRINDPEGTVDWDTIRRALEALPDDPA